MTNEHLQQMTEAKENKSIEELFDTLQCPEEWRVGFAEFTLRTMLTFGGLL